jgi:hypothetical protein
MLESTALNGSCSAPLILSDSRPAANAVRFGNLWLGAQRSLDVPFVMDGVVCVAANDVFESNRALLGMDHDQVGGCHVDGFDPVAYRSFEAPERRGRTDSVIRTRVGKRVVVAARDIRRSSERDAGETFGPDPEVVTGV